MIRTVNIFVVNKYYNKYFKVNIFTFFFKEKKNEKFIIENRNLHLYYSVIVFWECASFAKSEFHRTCLAGVFLNKYSSKHVCTDTSQRLWGKAL